MSDPPPASPEPVPAATLLLLRDGAAGLEVLMLERHPKVDFVPGAMVFPGGKVDASDADPVLAKRCAGTEGLGPEALSVRVAAIREAFEECGVLLARPRGAQALVSPQRLTALEANYRDALHAGRTSLADLVEAENLELACDLLAPFAHWITPEDVPRRYDTHFFAVAAPPDQVAVHDGRESVDSVWIAPVAALEAERAGRLTIILPTLLNLSKLGRSASVSEALDAARRARITTVLPRIERGASGPVVRIPAEADYDIVEAPVDSLTKAPLGGSARRSR